MQTTERLRAAGGTTKRYLTDLGINGWLKLGVVVLLFSIGSGAETNVLGAILPALSAEAIEWRQLAAPATIALVIAGVFGYIATVADFVVVASLRSGRLPLWSYARANLRRAGSLLVFRAAITIVAIGVVAGVIAATVGLTPPLTGTELSHSESLLIGVAGAIGVVGWLLVGTLTNAFVVPIMQYEHRGPLSAWRRFVGAIAGQWIAVFGFVGIAFLITAVVAVALFLLSFILIVVGFLLIGGGWALVVERVPALEPLAVVVIVVSYLCYRYLLALLRAPVRCYLRYYALLLLGDVEPTLAMINGGLTRSDASDATDAAMTDDTGVDGTDTGDEPIDSSQPSIPPNNRRRGSPTDYSLSTDRSRSAYSDIRTKSIRTQ